MSPAVLRARRPGRRLLFVVAALLSVLAAGCGGDDDGSSSGDGSGGGDKPRLVVSAASSMTEALTRCSADFSAADVKLSFAGSDELAAQIRQGVKPDVFAAANTKLPDALHDEGLLSKPTEFATNTLVAAVRKNSTYAAIEDFGNDGVTLVVGSPSVPIGIYTREVLKRLPGLSNDVIANIRSNEPDVKGIVGKLTQGAADGGFVYESDVKATNGALRALPLPPSTQPEVVYAAGVVDGAKQPALARRYVQGLVDGGCYRALQAAGFGPLK